MRCFTSSYEAFRKTSLAVAYDNSSNFLIQAKSTQSTGTKTSEEVTAAAVVSSSPFTHLFFSKKFSLFWYFLALLVAQQYLNEILSFVVFVFEMIEQDSCIEVVFGRRAPSRYDF
jgi:hypothetical protein